MKIDKNLYKELVSIRRKIHKNPELNFSLDNTKKIIINELKKEKIDFYEIEGSIFAKIEGKKNKNILFRADMDALPMLEKTNLIFKSNNLNAHCCGHDIHTTVLLGLLKYLNVNKVNGTIYALFQADEEGGEGAKKIVNSGLFDKYNFQKVFALHLDAKLPYKTISYGLGKTFASNTNFKITINGKTAHGARSYEGIDPINIGIKFCEMLYSILNREVSVFEHNIFSITAFNSGNAYNIIPNKAEIFATLRTYDVENKKYIIKRFCEIVKFFEMNYKIKINFEKQKEIPFVITDEKFTKEILNLVKDFEKNEYIKNITEKPSLKLGSEDFAFLSEKIKESAYFFIGAGPNDKKGYHVGQHNSEVIFNEKSILSSLELLIKIANKYLI